jgi:LexA DNA binding domain
MHTVPQLTLEQRQVAAFVGDYLREYEHLPVAMEVARGCGFRSPRSAERVLRELEGKGVIRRDGRYQRLGRMVLDVEGQTYDPGSQLFLAELAIIELSTMLHGIRRGLELAGTADRWAALHLEGLRRSVLIQAFEATAGHLRAAGLRLERSDVKALDAGRAAIEELDSLYVDWDSFCVARRAWNLSALEWTLGTDPLELGYAGASLVAVRKALTDFVNASRHDVRRVLADPTPQIERLLEDLNELLGRFRTAMQPRFEMDPAMLDVSSRRLLART